MLSLLKQEFGKHVDITYITVVTVMPLDLWKSDLKSYQSSYRLPNSTVILDNIVS